MKFGCVSLGLVAWAVSAGMSGSAAAQDVAILQSASRSPQYMRMYGDAQPPYGFVRFCDAQPKECQPTGYDDGRFQATPARLSELDAINRTVNRQIEPATDLEIYGVTEYWTLPRSRGDCEDYALLKRRNLIMRGWPSSALLITVVRDEKDEGHAVLTARTTQGDFILDNKVEQVKLWNQTPYRFVMRQSYRDPKYWVSLDPSDGVTPSASAGVKSNP